MKKQIIWAQAMVNQTTEIQILIAEKTEDQINTKEILLRKKNWWSTKYKLKNGLMSVKIPKSIDCFKYYMSINTTQKLVRKNEYNYVESIGKWINK